MTKTFLLGVGAQKSGTSWLHDYLCAAQGVDMGVMKEYHVWDATTIATHRVFDCRRQTLSGFRQRITPLAYNLFRAVPSELALRQMMQRNSRTYFDYFAVRLNRRGISLTGDITPSYNALPAEVLKKIRDEFADRSVEVKVVFLMRDPLERCWSAIRMYRKNGQSMQGADVSMDEEQALLAYVRTKDAGLRTDYRATVENLEQVFAPNQIYYGLFETMFETQEIARLSQFLGIPSDPTRAERHVNVSKKNRILDAQTQNAVTRYFAPVYEYCRQRFPETETHWHIPA